MGILRILAVDDHEEAIRPLAKFLESEGFDVCLAFDGSSAIRMAMAFHPDVILLDIRMPSISGIDVAKLFRQLPRFNSSTLIAITGHDDKSTRDAIENAGISHVFRKPCDYSQLANLLRSLCRAERRSQASPGPQSG